MLNIQMYVLQRHAIIYMTKALGENVFFHYLKAVALHDKTLFITLKHKQILCIFLILLCHICQNRFGHGMVA